MKASSAAQSIVGVTASRRRPPRLRIWSLATAAVMGARALGAQQGIDSPAMHPRGSVRDPKEEERILASPDSATHWHRAYRLAAPPDAVYKYFRWKLGAALGQPVDTAAVPDDNISPVHYMTQLYTFADECLDPPASSGEAGSTAPPCRTWRRGKDKKMVLGNALAASEGGGWLEGATFVWYHREANGALSRLRVRVRDAGLAENWKRYTLATLVILDSTLLHGPTK